MNGDEADEDDAAYLCHSCAPNEEFEDFEDAIEQDVVCAFLAAQYDLNDKEVCEDIADSVHHEYVALVTREQAMKRGVPLQRVVHQFRPPLSELTVEQRRTKVAFAKKNSTCRRCSQSGHWAGDAECPLRRKSTPQEAHQHKVQTRGRF